jgi:hypothetical protein
MWAQSTHASNVEFGIDSKSVQFCPQVQHHFWVFIWCKTDCCTDLNSLVLHSFRRYFCGLVEALDVNAVGNPQYRAVTPKALPYIRKRKL